ncbi:MAG TPA: helix-turn-helix domain-containing protein [Streptosporangiaceae bacterium]|nr:helix-turn-helix domain-containing protein [Streptosporangiaceae bacterium]
MASDFSEALSLSLTGRRHVDEDSSYAELLADLAAAAGSKAAAARALGVSPTTFYRWVSGRSSRPGRPAQRPSVPKATIVKAIRARQLSPDLAQRIRDKRATIKIKGYFIVSSDSRKHPRTIHCGRDFPASVQGEILDAWLDGNDELAEQITFDAIGEYYVEGMDIDGIVSIEWENNG